MGRGHLLSATAGEVTFRSGDPRRDLGPEGRLPGAAREWTLFPSAIR